MKRDELIKKLKELPEDVDVVVMTGDSVLNDYEFVDPSFTLSTAYVDQKGTMFTEHSSFRAWGSTEKIKVVVVGD